MAYPSELILLSMGVPRDYRMALRWLRRAAREGHAGAQVSLGQAYRYGKGVSTDRKVAMQWHRRAAEQGNADAHYHLGVMYAKGQAAPQDYISAHMWANIAASALEDKERKLLMKARAGLRDRLEEKMTPSQIAEAQKLARECERRQYKDC